MKKKWNQGAGNEDAAKYNPPQFNNLGVLWPDKIKIKGTIAIAGSRTEAGNNLAPYTGGGGWITTRAMNFLTETDPPAYQESGADFTMNSIFPLHTTTAATRDVAYDFPGNKRTNMRPVSDIGLSSMMRHRYRKCSIRKVYWLLQARNKPETSTEVGLNVSVSPEAGVNPGLGGKDPYDSYYLGANRYSKTIYFPATPANVTSIQAMSGVFKPWKFIGITKEELLN